MKINEEMKINDLYKGLNIVEATIAEAGPVAGQTFAMLGANVIHIERPADHPDHRFVGHCVRQNNKKSITLDTKSEEGKAIMWRLLEKADVFLENFAPGAWDRMGFTYEAVKARNPRMVYVSVKGFAKTTRFEKCITYDPVACCSGGGTYLTGLEDGDPMLCGINVGDSGAAIVTSTLMAAAILRQKVTGKGCFLESPMQNAVVSECRESFAEYYASDGNVRRAGNSYRGVRPTAPWNIYPCQGNDVTGNYICITCSPDPESDDFEKLCRIMEREDLLENPDYATPELRYKNRHSLDYEISRWTIRHAKRELMTKLAIENGIPAGVVLGPGDMVRGKKQGDSRGILRWLPLGDEYCRNKEGKILDGCYMPTLPLRMDAGDIVPTNPGRFDSCNKEILGGWLGLSDAELAELKEKRII
jgi:formyl-CoA transferase